MIALEKEKKMLVAPKNIVVPSNVFLITWTVCLCFVRNFVNVREVIVALSLMRNPMKK